MANPGSASTFCNIPRCIEQNVEWVTALLRHMLEKGYQRIEPTLAAEAAWTEHVHETAARLLAIDIDSWMTGGNRNVPGRQKCTFTAYAGGAPKYREKCDQIAANGYEGFVLA